MSLNRRLELFERKMKMYRLKKTDDYKSLTEMFYNNGLEIDICEKAPKEVLQTWEMIESNNGKRVGGMAIEKRAGEYVLADLAVEENYRGNYLGVQMVDRALDEIRQMGGKKVLLVAKIPEFYKKWNFMSMKREDAPNISKCMTCHKFNKECFPEVMYLDL